MGRKDVGSLFSKKYPKASERKSRNDLNGELEVLANYLKPKSKEARKVLTLRRQLKDSVFYMFRNVKMLTSIDEYATSRPSCMGKSVQSHKCRVGHILL
ncbi:hypothetical protein RclHR1_00390004 [Rhizophagus clarus]|uniref:BHLH domain-containing protein n=1 Tax=Rhizophagus clarus TaxID=94130 RepID=A0A2Z6RU45_9GLOM|nr:hypothetical protein RclHR1_00390004 [Rhizophagus clarus]